MTTCSIFYTNWYSIQEGGSVDHRKLTTTTYEPEFGNVTQVAEFINGARQRITTFETNVLSDTANYIVDRPKSKTIFDGLWNVHALTYYFYDGRTTTFGLGSSGGRYDGNLTLERVYYDVPVTTGYLIGETLHSTDTSYEYDDYGNQTKVITYEGPGTLVRGGSGSGFTSAFSAPGKGTPPSTTTTGYDMTFRVFPESMSQSSGTTTLTQGAGWNKRMGVLTGVTDANGNVTGAGYDTFGRMVKLWKPGDSQSVPTGEFTYDTTDVPFAYRIKRREASGIVDAYRPSVIFYDGMGRKIQTQEETVDGAQMRVTDTVFDGLDRATAQSVPRYVNSTPSAFGDFVTTPTVTCGTGVWSCTTYDALGRQRLVTGPDGNATNYQYGVESAGLTTVVTDANGHRKKNTTDVFSRLKNVSEYTGTSSPYALYASTAYQYNALDLLTKVTDDADNETVLTYDSAGRKTTIKDPDMGSWAYTYDVAGNLVAQTDAMTQTMLFGYDDLNRLTSKLGATYTGYSDSFGSKSTDWTWTTHQTVIGSGNTQIRNTGTGSTGWEATFYRPYNLTNREGVQISFKLNADNTDALFALEANDPDPYFSANHPRFAVEAITTTLRVQSTDGTGTWRYVPLMEDIVAGQWYVLTMGIDDNGGFTAHVYPKGQPHKATSRRVLLPNARNQTWRFRNDVRNNSVDLDDYREYNGAGYKYDEGTNGKGQRTTMINPGVSNSWSYDSRGRMTTANFVQSSLNWSMQTGYDAADRVTSLTYPSGETINYTYDAGWRQSSICSATYSVCYADTTTFDPLDQPESWQLGNGLWANWVYTALTKRVYALKVGTATTNNPSGAHLWYRYGYDDVGNVATIADLNSSGVVRETQTFGYDHLDRLVSASAGGYAGGPGNYSSTYTSIPTPVMQL